MSHVSTDTWGSGRLHDVEAITYRDSRAPILYTGSGRFCLAAPRSSGETEQSTTRPSTRTAMQPIAIYHEHPDWFKPLFAELERRGLAVRAARRVRARVRSVGSRTRRTRSSSTARVRPRTCAAIAQSTFHTLHWLRHLERIGIPVVNGSQVYSFELSKASQLDLLEELGLPYPKSRAINNASLAAKAAEGLRYPVLVKANIGGIGCRHRSLREPRRRSQGAIDRGEVQLGIDGVALVQESAPLRDGHIVRVETMGGKYLYAIKVFPAVGSFDLCPADACQTNDGVELVRGACAVDAPKTGLARGRLRRRRNEIIEQVEAISRALGSRHRRHRVSRSTTATASTTSTTSTRCRTSSPIR